MIEVHHEPEKAFSDGPQSLKPEKFARLMDSVARVHAACMPLPLTESVADTHAAI
jgi:3-deoxy-7-phosphoheptulonate synthase